MMIRWRLGESPQRADANVVRIAWQGASYASSTKVFRGACDESR